MRGLTLSVLFFISLTAAHADTNQNLSTNSFYPSYCTNIGDKVSYSFTSCVNSNFQRLGFELDGVFLSYCSNFGDELSYSFTSCVNRNFQEVERNLGMFLGHCMNIGSGVSYSFISCINSNMSDISYEIQRQK